MADDFTRGRRGFEGRGDQTDRPSGGFPKRDDQFSRESGPRESGPREEGDGGRAPRPPFQGRDGASEGRSDRPFRSAGNDRPPFRSAGNDRPPFRSAGNDRPPFRGAGNDRPPFRGAGNDRPPFRGAGNDRPPFRGAGNDRPPFRSAGNDRPPFRGAGNDRPPFRPTPREDRPPFAEGQRDERPAFEPGSRDERPVVRGDRPGFQPERPEGRPWQREGGRPSPWNRGEGQRQEGPTYRQGRGGYRSFDQDLGRGDRPAYGGGNRPFPPKREEGERPYRRPEGDRPSFRDRQPAPGGRPFERRDSEGAPFGGAGRPLGTVTRAGRSPVSQFERIQADVYGRWPVLESLRAGSVLKVYLAAGVKDSADHLQEIQSVAAEKHVLVVRVDRFDLDRVLGSVNHQGIAAACRPFQYTPFEKVMERAAASGEKPLVVLFDGVQDPQNLGSILRTAEASGVDGAVLPKHNQAGVSPAVVRASAGAAEHLPIAEVTNLRQSIATLKEAGYWIVGLDMDGGTDYDNFDVDSPVALVVGSEGRGISRMISEECDYLVRLPMRGKVGSLNASVAAGIVLYEIGRRRGTAHTPKQSDSASVEAADSAAIEDDDFQALDAALEETELGPEESTDENLEGLEGEFLPGDLEEGDEVKSEDVEKGVEDVLKAEDLSAPHDAVADQAPGDEAATQEHPATATGEAGTTPAV